MSIERKSLPDFVASISQGRDRFKRELERLRENVEHPFIFVEGSRAQVEEHDYRSRMHPNAVAGTALAIAVDYGIPVHWASNRLIAERDALRLFARIERKHELAREAECSGGDA